MKSNEASLLALASLTTGQEHELPNVAAGTQCKCIKPVISQRYLMTNGHTKRISYMDPRHNPYAANAPLKHHANARSTPCCSLVPIRPADLGFCDLV